MHLTHNAIHTATTHPCDAYIPRPPRPTSARVLSMSLSSKCTPCRLPRPPPVWWWWWWWLWCRLSEAKERAATATGGTARTRRPVGPSAVSPLPLVPGRLLEGCSMRCEGNTNHQAWRAENRTGGKGGTVLVRMLMVKGKGGNTLAGQGRLSKASTGPTY